MTDFTAYVFLQLALSDVFGHVHVPQYFVLQGAELNEPFRESDVQELLSLELQRWQARRLRPSSCRTLSHF